MATTTSDTLGPLGIGFGALLVLVGIATLFGTPWAHKSGGAALAAGQILGSVAAIAIGAGLVWIARK